VPRPSTQVKVGCCGFALAQARYFQTFPCVEINSSFYQLPKVETAARWRAAAPEDFQFALKAWQVITHPANSPTYKRTRLDPRDAEYCGHFGFNPTVRWAWDETYAVATALRAFLVLFQCPASFRSTKENVASLRRFFEKAKRGKFFMGWEPRGEWDAELVAKLCGELDLVYIVDPLKNAVPVPAKIRYFRLHGVSGYRHQFTNDELERLRTICSAGRGPAYCFFNNVSMAADAQRFVRLLPVPSQPSRRI
jgi:uncharacterized protein YecE (DUF72 family)